MAAKEYIHFIDDLGVHLSKREFDNGARIWDAAIRSAEALKPSHNSDYAAALRKCLNEWGYDHGFSLPCHRWNGLYQRLNALRSKQRTRLRSL
jgi:hypothetical protein